MTINYGHPTPEWCSEPLEYSMLQLLATVAELIEKGYNVMILADNNGVERETVIVFITTAHKFGQR